jgi:uncharacterized protein YkwD
MRRSGWIRAVGVIGLLVSGTAGASPPPAARPQVSPEAAVLAEVNFARTHPREYVRHLREVAAETERSGRYANPADGDEGALDEAIRFLEQQTAVAPLAPEALLQTTARDHVEAQSRTGETGHGEGDRGFSERLKHHGVFAGISAEDIAYGYSRPRDVVAQLVIDRGIRGRGHRVNIFEPNFRVAGVACGPHPSYGEMCVIDFATPLIRPGG